MAFPSYNFPTFGKELATTENMVSVRNDQNNTKESSMASNLNNTNKENGNLSNRIKVNHNNNEHNGQDTTTADKDKKPSILNKSNNGTLDTSIISIESKHKEYTIYSPIKDLKNMELNNMIKFESKINEFANLLVENASMNHIYHLTLGQLIRKDLLKTKTDMEYFKLIKNMVKDKELMRKNKISELRILCNQPNIQIKRILVAYIVYQYFAYFGLQAIETVNEITLYKWSNEILCKCRTINSTNVCRIHWRREKTRP